MVLNGDCLLAFEKWYLTRKHFDSLTVFESGKINQFSNLPFNMKYGVYVDFFDSVGIYPDIQPVLNYDEDGYTEISHFIVNVFYTGNFNDDYIMLNTFNSRPEARTTAIEKANQIFNER